VVPVKVDIPVRRHTRRHGRFGLGQQSGGLAGVLVQVRYPTVAPEQIAAGFSFKQGVSGLLQQFVDARIGLFVPGETVIALTHRYHLCHRLALGFAAGPLGEVVARGAAHVPGPGLHMGLIPGRMLFDVAGQGYGL